MKAKLKICSGCEELKVIWKNHEGMKYCKYCWTRWCAQHKSVKKPTKQYRIPSRSSKRAIEEREYSKLRKIYLSSHSQCKARIPNHCTGVATQVHHKKGRIGSLLLDIRFWLPVCHACHSWVDLNSAAAEELKLTIKRSTAE